ncbi:MAG: DUF4301 family protein [Cyclobacteriaceae bacterium]|nr:DUF4301 family protein [Cyclobacteriaceae bacterium]
MNAKLQQQILFQKMNPSQVDDELRHFREGFPFIKIIKPALIGDGIVVVSDTLASDCISYYSDKCKSLTIVKFVPASGAASRMFKALYDFLDDEEMTEIIQVFIDSIDNFAFSTVLDEALSHQGSAIKKLIDQKEYKKLIRTLLHKEGLNYGWLPKGLLLFHKGENDVITPVEEHLREAIAYAVGKDDGITIHFTISPEHLDGFQNLLDELMLKFKKHNINVTFSQQKVKTNTIAVDLQNQPFEDEDGSLIFRPAGHGALIENLNDINADLIFIKNIDNVVPDRLRDETITYKKILAGWLLSVQQQSFSFLHQLETDTSENLIIEIEKFMQNTMCIHFQEEYKHWNIKKKIAYLIKKLDRPMRVCGMVKNTGEPGGGPFWVAESNGEVSLQIVEMSQLDLHDANTQHCVQKATHFNPVDLVCGVKNYKGEKFNLLEYRDINTGFVTQKSKSGKELKALELPGLWNGAMANWNTLFVEVPQITFNPVKTVNDLLRQEHQ